IIRLNAERTEAFEAASDLVRLVQVLLGEGRGGAIGVTAIALGAVGTIGVAVGCRLGARRGGTRLVLDPPLALFGTLLANELVKLLLRIEPVLLAADEHAVGGQLAVLEPLEVAAQVDAAALEDLDAVFHLVESSHEAGKTLAFEGGSGAVLDHSQFRPIQA